MKVWTPSEEGGVQAGSLKLNRRTHFSCVCCFSSSHPSPPSPPPLSSNASPSEGTPVMGNIGCTPQSLPKFQHPSHELLKENGFTQHVYHKYRRRCLNGRSLRSSVSERSLVSRSSSDPVPSASSPPTDHRTEAAGNRPIAGNEHALPLLVVLPERSLQQEDVRGVQTVGAGGRERRLQVSV